MIIKKIVTVVLLGFVGISVACLVIQETTSAPVLDSADGKASNAEPGSAEAESTGAVGQTVHRLVAYYFHRTQRCQTCLKMESYAHDALKDAFGKSLKSGELEWRTVNLEEPANEHFVEDFQLAASSLVLVDTQDGERREWRNLERVWELVGSESEFKAYVKAQATVFLDEAS